MNFIQKGWHGEYSLRRAFWVNTVLVNAVLIVIFSFLLSFFLNDKKLVIRLIMNYNILSVFIGIWQTFGVWRSARTFIKENKLVLLGYLAQILTLIYFFRISLSLFLLLFFQEESILHLENQIDTILELKALAEQTPA